MATDYSSVSAFPKLAKPAQRALANAGYDRLSQLSGKSEAELMQLHGMGPKAMGELRKALEGQGFRLKPLSFAVQFGTRLSHKQDRSLD
ncbi:DNA-binding protein [Paenibacillus paeoniae]|uniref:DNA-binding protein n=1 Tax=Paenibacillus paeoniae TaxID=2292705 RepID=UPI001F0C716B|nr:DNA-binding protein [Paenibacillus paeoniae]